MPIDGAKSNPKPNRFFLGKWRSQIICRDQIVFSCPIVGNFEPKKHVCERHIHFAQGKTARSSANRASSGSIFPEDVLHPDTYP